MAQWGALRVETVRHEWDYNFEAVFQWGSFGSDEVFAWTAASDTGYTFRGIAGKPRVALRTDLISGDNDPNDNRLGTFNALFPRGSYFGEISLIGPANLIDVHPTLELHLTTAPTFTADWDFFRRFSTDDGRTATAATSFAAPAAGLGSSAINQVSVSNGRSGGTRR
jgi:hypothetical protein